MLVLTINRKSTLEDIVYEKCGGIDTSYILNSESNKRLDLLVSIANKLKQNDITPFIEVKFVTRYSSREKRIEIVGRDNYSITIYKLSSFSRYDKDAIDIDRLLSEIKEKFNSSQFTFGAELLFKSSDDIKAIAESIKKMDLSVGVGSY